MAEQPVIVQKISWSDLCPWTIIFKTLPIASSVTVLVFAVLGIVLTPMGWLLSDSIFINEGLQQDNELMRVVQINRSPYRGVFLSKEAHTESISVFGAELSGPRAVFSQYVAPFEYLFSNQRSALPPDAAKEVGRYGFRKFLYFFFGCLWSIFVWSFVGVAITRVALLRLTRNEQSGIDDAFEFAFDKWLTTAGAIGVPLIATAVLCIPTFVIGLMMGFDFGVVVAGILWFIVLACSIGMGLLLLGLLFGWPLMVSSVSCESQNSFDAMTRAYAYVFQRPLKYVLYSLVAILFGGFCWMIVAGLTNGIIGLSFWSTSWGANVVSAERIDIVQGIVAVNEDGSQAMVDNGSSLISLWHALLKTVSAAFIYGLFWCMAAAVYLLLRKDVDETEMDEIFLSEEKRTYELPPLQSDEQGIPQIQDPTPVREPVSDLDDSGNEASDGSADEGSSSDSE
jgi:hypothetical protein